MSDEFDVAKMVDKITKLMQKAEHPGTPEHEKEVCTRMAAEIMAKYNIDQNTVFQNNLAKGISREKCRIKVVENICYGAWHISHHDFCGPIAAFCEVDIWKNTGNKTFTFFGLPSDVEAAAYFHDTLATFCVEETKKYRASEDYDIERSRGEDGKRLLTAFIKGYKHRMSMRFRKMMEERSKIIKSSNALVIVKKDLIKVDMEERGIKLRSSSTQQRAGATHTKAFLLGQAAADRANISRGIGAGNKRIKGE